ncbi:MAG: hypothetical protein FK732_12570 [Asgard group archaeon]|nr:hypothetical protein [Asgard group archaeon]
MIHGSTRLTETDLPIRIQNALMRHGCDTVEKLIYRFENDGLLNIRNFGELSLKQVEKFIQENDFTTVKGFKEEKKSLNKAIRRFNYKEYSLIDDLKDENRLELRIRNTESLLNLLSNLTREGELNQEILAGIENEILDEIYDSLVQNRIQKKESHLIYISDFEIPKSIRISFLLYNLRTLEEIIAYSIKEVDPYGINNQIGFILNHTVLELTGLDEESIQEKKWFKTIDRQIDEVSSWISENNINQTTVIQGRNLSDYFNINLINEKIIKILEKSIVIEYLSQNSLSVEVNKISERLTEREKSVLISRYGIKKQTLEEISEKENVSRERIRQIESKASMKIRPRIRNGFDDFIYLNIFIRQAMNLNCDYSFFSLINKFGQMATRKSISGKKKSGIHLSPETSLLLAFLHLGNDQFPSYLQDTIEKIYFSSDFPDVNYTAAEFEYKSKSRVRKIYKKTRNSGAIHENDHLLKDLDQKTVHQIMNLLEFETIKEKWFTKNVDFSNGIYPQNESLLNNTLRILKVCPKALINEVHQGIKNPINRLGYQVVPFDIYKQVLLLNDFLIHKEYLYIYRENNIKLGNRDKFFVELTREKGPVVTFDEICSKFEEKGFSRASAVASTQWSPIVFRISQGLYKICGLCINPEDYSVAEARRQRVANEFEYRYTTEGEIIFELNIGGWAEGGTISIHKLPDIQGTWKYKHNNQTIEITANEDFIYGFLPIFENLGIKKSDRARFVLNTWNRTLKVERIDE